MQPRLPLTSRAALTSAACTLLLLWLAQAAAAQQSQYDRGTPPQHAAGFTQFGSFAWADLGTVNLANGALNIRLPLGTVGGRGLSLPLTLNYSSKVWSGRIDTEYHGLGLPRDVSSENEPPVAYAEYAEGDDIVSLYSRIAPGWTVGFAPLMKVRGVPIRKIPNNPNTCGWSYGLVKLTLVLPDKGEIEFRDDLTNGAPLPAQLGPGTCFATDGYRGRRWHATDGSGMIFVSDADNAVSRGDLNGVLITAEGTRYRFSGGSALSDLSHLVGDGVASSITDRHGNRITISGTTYTDPLGRVTRIQQNVPDPDDPSVTLPFLVTFPGYNGTSRHIKIKLGVMNQNYRAGINPALPVVNGDYDPRSFGYDWPGTSLFQKSYGLYAYRIDDLRVVTEVVLPDGRSLRFKYNQFGEVAEVLYPTGGRAEYDYGKAASLPSGNSPLWETTTQTVELSSEVTGVDRAVRSRRVYADGTNLESSWSYGYGPEAHNGASYNCTHVTATSAAGAVLLRRRHFFLRPGRYTESYTNTSNHDGTHYSLWSTGVEWRTETLDAGGAVLAAGEQDWAQRAPVAWPSYTQEQPANDNRVNEERKILDTGAVARVGYAYDQYSNPVEVREYDYNQALVRRTVTSYLNANNGYNYQADDRIRLLRLPALTTVFDGAGNRVAETAYAYDEAAYPALAYAAISGWAAPPTPARGNATTVSRWLDRPNSWLPTHAQYDQAGNVRYSWDARGNRSQVSYADSFSDAVARNTYAYPTQTASAVPDPTNQRATNTPLATSTTYDYSTGLVRTTTDPNGKATSFQYNDPLHRPTRVDRPDGGWTVYWYDRNQYGDYVGTRTAINATQSTEGYQFFDGLGRPARSFQFQNNLTDWITVDTQYDALGRKWRVSRPYLSGGSPAPVNPSGRWTTTQYDALGRVKSVTTPDGAAVNTSYGGNTVTVTDQAGKQRRSVSDALGRLTQVVEDPSGLAYQTNYLYDALGNLRRVEQGGQHRHFMYDSLGRLVRARNPEQAVNASLNTGADPWSGNAQWSLGYSYDANSNLYQRTDARNVTTTHTYDNLDRVVRTDYSDGTPMTLLAYDFATNGRGRFYSDYESSTTGTINYVFAYDEAGRPTSRGAYFYLNGAGWLPGYFAARAYDKAGNVTAQTYPSGRTVSYTQFDAAGRLKQVTGTLGDGAPRTYSTSIRYDEASRIVQEQFGTQVPLYHKRHYNARGQLYDVRLSTVAWQPDGAGEWEWNRGCLALYYGGAAHGQSGPSNNGNVTTAEHWVPANDQTTAYNYTQQTFAYDSINRLSSVTERAGTNLGFAQAHGAQHYTYDRWGNRTINGALTSGTNFPEPGFELSPAANREVPEPSNRLYAPGDAGRAPAQKMMRYDAAGNLVHDSHTGGGARTYDAENRMTSAWGYSALLNAPFQSRYTYDAAGKRVRRLLDAGEVWHVYGFDGELLAEYAAGGAPSQPRKEYAYRAGEMLVAAEPNGQARWLVSDHLGTPRMTADQTGSLSGVRRHDYLPFGEELTAGAGGRTPAQGYAADNLRQKFTAYERDPETNLDFAEARYYNSQQGRFSSPDPLLASALAASPQTWNRYTYVANRPLSLVDPSGMLATSPDQQQEQQQPKVPQEVRDFGATSWTAIGESGDRAVFSLSKRAAEALAQNAVIEYLTEWNKTTDLCNDLKNGPVISTTVTTQLSGSDSAGSSTETTTGVTAGVSGGQPNVGASTSTTEGQNSQFTRGSGTSINQSVDGSARSAARAADRALAASGTNALNALTGSRVTLVADGRRRPAIITVEAARVMVGQNAVQARARGFLDAFKNFPEGCWPK